MKMRMGLVAALLLAVGCGSSPEGYRLVAHWKPEGDFDKDQVAVFSSEGRWLRNFGELESPTDVATDCDGKS
jgi:hypothetical protein